VPCNCDELIDLQGHWGSAYDLAFDGQAWTATRRDTGETLTASSADKPREAIRLDYRRNPVPRDL
jgi:hypothetical protein